MYAPAVEAVAAGGAVDVDAETLRARLVARRARLAPLCEVEPVKQDVPLIKYYQLVREAYHQAATEVKRGAWDMAYVSMAKCIKLRTLVIPHHRDYEQPLFRRESEWFSAQQPLELFGAIFDGMGQAERDAMARERVKAVEEPARIEAARTSRLRPHMPPPPPPSSASQVEQLNGLTSERPWYQQMTPMPTRPQMPPPPPPSLSPTSLPAPIPLNVQRPTARFKSEDTRDDRSRSPTRDDRSRSPTRGDRSRSPARDARSNSPTRGMRVSLSRERNQQPTTPASGRVVDLDELTNEVPEGERSHQPITSRVVDLDEMTTEVHGGEWNRKSFAPATSRVVNVDELTKEELEEMAFKRLSEEAARLRAAYVPVSRPRNRPPPPSPPISPPAKVSFVLPKTVRRSHVEAPENSNEWTTPLRPTRVSTTSSDPGPILHQSTATTLLEPRLSLDNSSPLPRGSAHLRSREVMNRSARVRALDIPTKIISLFTKVAEPNTNQLPRGIETCGVLAGIQRGSRFLITTLIIPEQTGTADTCSMTNEADLSNYCITNKLLMLGWIHTHPRQACFMSSVDLHTHHSFQSLHPEAVAIVVAPTDRERNVGIFRLSEEGMDLIQDCMLSGFHSHPSNIKIYSDAVACDWDAHTQPTVVDLRNGGQNPRILLF